MKYLIIVFVSLLTYQDAFATDNGAEKRKRKSKSEVAVKSALDNQINKHIFNPGHTGNVEGEADVMLRVMPEGNIQVVLIQTKNPLLSHFIERQVKKMKVEKNELVVGELFKYRLVFRAQ